MRTRVIPAQITTVEDKIVGSLNLMQMIILMAPVFFTTFIYALMPPSMNFVTYKLTISAVSFILCLILAMRIKGKVVVDWLSILLRYNSRSKYYIYNKNEAHLRYMYIPTLQKEKVIEKSSTKAKKSVKNEPIKERVKNLVTLENIISGQDVAFRYKVNKKGGLHVAFEQIKK